MTVEFFAHVTDTGARGLRIEVINDERGYGLPTIANDYWKQGEEDYIWWTSIKAPLYQKAKELINAQAGGLIGRTSLWLTLNERGELVGASK